MRGVRHGRAPRGLDPRPAARLDRGAQRRSPPGAWSRPPSARAWSASCSSPRSAPPRTTARASSAPRRWPSRRCARPTCARSSSRPRIVYAPGDRWLTLLERLALLPVMPVSGRGRAVYQPIWAEDVADCVDGGAARRGPGARRRTQRALRAGRPRDAQPHRDRAPGAALAASAAGRWCTCPPRSSRARCGCSRRMLGTRRRSPPGTRPS